MDNTPTNQPHKQWAMRDLNPHSMDYESTALTVKLIAQSEKNVTGIRTTKENLNILLTSLPKSPHFGFLF